MNERKTAVITGASSGIGRATALEFAARGYGVVLIARRKDELEIVAAECRELGVETVVGVADTTDETAVMRVMDEALERFGKLDVWVNCAGVYVAGRLDDLPLKDIRRVFETNIIGYVVGARAALKLFKKQESGTLITVSSVNAQAPQPYGAPYGASKAAVRAIDEALRMELRLDGLSSKIHVCTVLPGPVDTNIYRNSANYTGRELLPPEPVYDPIHVAERIVGLAARPRREIFIGRAGRLFALQHTLLPRLYERTTPPYTKADVLGKTSASDTPGNLYASIESHRGITGGWRNRRIKGETVDRALAIGAVSLGAIAAIVALAVVSNKEEK